MDLIIDWQSLKILTGYEREDIKGFCEDEGFPVYPGRLHPFQALSLRNLLLCCWSVREGHFDFYWQAQKAFDLFWADLPDDISDRQLAASWMAWCQRIELLGSKAEQQAGAAPVPSQAQTHAPAAVPVGVGAGDGNDIPF